MIDRSIVGQRGVRNLGDNLAVLQHAHGWLIDDAADGDRVQSPLLEDAEDLVLAALLGHQQHALLRLAQHDLVRRHAGFALRHQVEFDFQADAAAATHLAGRAGQAGRAHVLNADDRAGLHGFQAGLQQQLLHEGIAHLHVRTLRLGLLAELLAGHGGAVNAVAPGLGADVDHGIARAGGLGIENLVASDQSEGKRIDQRIARVAALELHLAADIRHAKAVAVGGDAAHHAFHHGVVLVQRLLVDSGLGCDRPKAQRVHDGDRTRAHGEDVAQDAANAGRRTLERLDERRMIVRLDLEGAGPAVADVDDAGVLARPLHYAAAVRWQAPQVNARRLVGAMLAVHHAEDAELGQAGLAAQRLQDAFVLLGRDAVVAQHFWSNGGFFGVAGSALNWVHG